MEESALGMGQKESARSVAMKDVPPQPKVEEAALDMGQSARSVPTKDAPIRSCVEESVLGMGQSSRNVTTKDVPCGPQSGHMLIHICAHRRCAKVAKRPRRRADRARYRGAPSTTS